MVSTASDMAKFMMAHLGEGCYREVCILQAATIAEMHRRRTSTPYESQAMTYGFIEGLLNGQRLIGHSGAIRGFGSILDMLTEHDCGYFFSFNLECLDSSACQIIPGFRQRFLDRFFPLSFWKRPFALERTPNVRGLVGVLPPAVPDPADPSPEGRECTARVGRTADEAQRGNRL
jgi:hypothetical protein